MSCFPPTTEAQALKSLHFALREGTAVRSLCPATKSSPDSPQLKERKLMHSNEDRAQPKGNKNFKNSNLGIKHKSLTKM